MKQWKCGQCGAWVDAGWWRHNHVVEHRPTKDELIASRMRGDVDPLSAGETRFTIYYRSGKEPVREAAYVD